MKKILIGLGVVVALFVVAALVAPSLIPVETYKGQILSRIEAATGRKARIEGDFKLSVLPQLEFVAGKFALANAPGQTPPDMVTLDKLTVRLGLFPLLRGDVVIDSFVLDKPVLALAVDKSGKPNWQFDTKPGAAAKPGEAAAPSQPSQSGGAAGGSPLSGLTLGDVRIVEGHATYTDARSGAKYDIDAINMKVALPALTSPMKADGSLVWNKEKIALSLNAANPNALFEGKQTAVDAAVTSNPVKLSFKGQMANAPALSASGDVDLDVPSVRQLAAWTGNPLQAPGNGFGPLKIRGKLELAGAKVQFRNATLAFDAIKGTGDVRLDATGRRPYANIRVALDTLDVNPYLPPEAPAGEKGGARPAGSPTPSASAGGTKAQDWSDEPIDLSGLRAADADLDLNVGGLIVRKIKVGKSHVVGTLKEGRLTVDLTDMALYDGHGKAKLTADGSQQVPSIAADFALADFQANPFLSDAMDMQRLEGTANAMGQVTGHGASQRAIISSLNGAGSLKFLNGAIRGINLAAMVRNIQGAFLNPEAREQQKTDFAELGGTFTIRNGILSNNDMDMKSPLFRVAGKGTVDLPKRTVDYRVEPKLVASTEGQGGRSDLGGVMVPVLVQGPWDNLSYKPDLSGALGNIAKDPSKALEGLKGAIPGLGRGTTSGDAGSGTAAPSPPAPTQDKPADALKKLFGR